MQVWSLGQEDPLEEEMATHSSIFAWRIPWTEESNRLQSTRVQGVGYYWSELACMRMVFPVLMYRSNHKEGWEPKNWCLWIVVLEKTLESLLDCKEIQQVNPKGTQPWIFVGRTNAEGEAPIRWPPDAKILLTGTDPDAGKGWSQKKKLGGQGQDS